MYNTGMEIQTEGTTTGGQAMASMTAATKTGPQMHETRFGTLTVDPAEALHFEKGMLGVPEHQSFCVLPFPVKKFPQFRLLQAVGDGSLSFIVLPLPLDNELVAAEDLKEAAQDLDIDEANLAVYLVVNIYREVNHVRMSVNARAPVFIDNKARKGEQCVLKNNQYMVRQMLKGELARPVEGS